MERLFNQMLIVDVETTCWENWIAPLGQESEIIQVGLCLFDRASALPHGKRSIIVRPERSRVSEFCTKLTGLTQANVDTGVSFRLACSILKREYSAPERTWVSWGNYDKKMFQKQCRNRRIDYPFGDIIRGRHINLKNLFAVLIGLPEEIEIPDALRMLGLSFVGKLHRGNDDAWNIGVILSELCTMTRIMQKFS
jgi:inhibitor of KinA sporulation pathway (predicted exonuclease)